MTALDPLLVCIAAAVLVLIAHAVFAVAKHRSGDGEPGALPEGVATVLCGLAFLGPLSVLPFADQTTDVLILLGTLCAVVASSLPIVVLRRRRAPAAPPVIINRRVLSSPARPAPPVRKMRVVVPPGADPAEAVRSAITGPIPRIPLTPEQTGAAVAHASPQRVTGPTRWTPPSAIEPEGRPAQVDAQPESAQPEHELPPVLRDAEHATKALDEVDNAVLDVKSWLRLDR